MNKYKPEYLGKVIPADDPSKMTQFVENQYDAFNKAYDACKEQSDSIQNVQMASSSNNSTLVVQITASPEAISNIKETVKDDSSITVEGGKIAVKT